MKNCIPGKRPKTTLTTKKPRSRKENDTRIADSIKQMAEAIPAALAEKPSSAKAEDQKQDGFWGFSLMVYDKLQSMEKAEAEAKIAELTMVLYKPSAARLDTFDNFRVNWGQ